MPVPAVCPLVPAYTTCSSPNPPRATAFIRLPRAPGPDLRNPTAALRTAKNGAGANQTGYVRITPVVGTLGPPDDSDVSFLLQLSDVRCKTGVLCGDPNATAGPDYTGELQGTFTARITDKFNGGSSFTSRRPSSTCRSPSPPPARPPPRPPRAVHALLPPP